MILSLSRRVQAAARPILYRHSFWNACGFGLTTGSVLGLLALSFGADDAQTGLIYAANNATAWAAIFTTMLFTGRSTTAVWGGFWWTRAVVVFFYPVVQLLPSSSAQVWTLIGLCYLYCTARAMGIPASQSTQKALATSRELPRMIARTFTWTHIGLLLVTVFSYFTFRWAGKEREALAFTIVLGGGALANLMASWYITRLPVTGYLESGTLQTLGLAIRRTCRDPFLRETVLISLLSTATIVCFGYQVNALKKVFGCDSETVFLFIVLGLAGAIGTAWFLSVIGHRIPSATLIFSVNLLLALAGVAWVMAGLLGEGQRALLLLLCVVTSAACATAGTLMNRLRTDRLPKGLEVQTSVVYQLSDMIAALLAVGGIAAAERLGRGIVAGASPALGLHAYSHVFLLAAVLCLLGCALTLFLRGEESGSVIRNLALFTPINLLAIYRAQRLPSVAAGREALALEELLTWATPTSRELLLESLRSPDFSRRGAALRTLARTPLPEAAEEVLAEARDPDSPWRAEAATALGFAERPDLCPELRRLLDDPDPWVRASSLKSLLRLGDPLPDARIEELFDSCRSSRQRLEILLGVAATERRDLMLRLLGHELRRRPGASWNRTAFILAATLWERRVECQQLFAAEEELPGSGLTELQALLDQPLPPALSRERLQQLFAAEHYEELAQLLRSLLPSDQPADWLLCHDRTTALGCLYLWSLHRT